MRLILAVCLAAAVVSTGLAAEFASPTHQTIKLAAAGRIDIEAFRNNVSGTVHVIPADQNVLEVQVAPRHGDEGKIRVEIARSGNDVSIDVFSTAPRRFFGMFGAESTEATVTVRAPRASALHVRTVNGDVDTADITGEMRVSTVNGNLRVQHAGSSLSLHTVNGSVRASMARVDRNPDVRIATVNGGVELSVPHDFNTAVRTGTVNGAIENPLRNATGPGRVSIATVNGAITIEKR